MDILPLEQVDKICLLNRGANQCRYLAYNEKTNIIFHCLKVCQHEKEIVDTEHAAYLRRYKEIGKKDHNLPMGDNCDGWIGEFLEAS